MTATTNIAQLPTTLSGSFPVTRNSGWYDGIQFNWPTASAHAGQPLDLTGIAFYAQVRLTIGGAEVLLDLSTANDLLVNGGALGTLAFNVPRDRPSSGASGHMAGLPGGNGANLVMDIIAEGTDADGTARVVNLCQAGPLSVVAGNGITTPRGA